MALEEDDSMTNVPSRTINDFIVLGQCCVRPSQIIRLQTAERRGKNGMGLRLGYFIFAILHSSSNKTRNRRVLLARCATVTDVQIKLREYQQRINEALVRNKRLKQEEPQSESALFSFAQHTP